MSTFWWCVINDYDNGECAKPSAYVVLWILLPMILMVIWFAWKEVKTRSDLSELLPGLLVLVGMAIAALWTINSASAQSGDMQILSRHHMAKHALCHSGGSRKCRDACEKANALQDAAEDLALCASRHDLHDDCSAQAIDSHDAAEEYESAVNDTDGDCE